jgi:hypothetical protein
MKPNEIAPGVEAICYVCGRQFHKQSLYIRHRFIDFAKHGDFMLAKGCVAKTPTTVSNTPQQ